ncbi:MAG TPA: Asp23/Gls24 family envelope stress response protein [Clostridia bacterium]|jgi:uncharacterized alkaline shock family protein YloU|nr:Asp23/Gls24 family envelope stress response protein [Clostridia bacterium]
MPGVITTELGKVTIDEALIANIAGYAALENYGIASMSSKTAGDAILQLIGGENHKRGVKVSFSEEAGEVDIDLYVTLIYGVSLPAVAQNMMSNVRYKVNEMTGLKVRNVNIHVETVRT